MTPEQVRLLAEARAARGLPAPEEPLVLVEDVARECGRVRRTVLNHARHLVVRRPGDRRGWFRRSDAARIVQDLRPREVEGPDMTCGRCGEEFPPKFFTHAGSASGDTCNACWSEMYGERRRATCEGCGKRFQTRTKEGAAALCRACRLGEGAAAA
ncbi:MAG: hypothetical protein AB1941_10040 [Gemmatimonadota bacterium]